MESVPADKTGSSSLAAALKVEGSQMQCDLLYSEKVHFAAAASQHLLHSIVGTITTVASVAAAAQIVSDNPTFGGLCALIAAVGAAFLTFAKPDTRAERHLNAGRQLGALRVELRQLMNLDLGTVPDSQIRQTLGDAAKQKADIDLNAPGTTERQFKAAHKKIERGDFDGDESG